MNNEEILKQLEALKDEIKELNKLISSQSDLIRDLRSYIKKETNVSEKELDNITDDDLSKKVDDIVYGEVQADPTNPKDIVLSDAPRVDDSLIYGTDEDNYYNKINRELVDNYNKTKEDVEESDTKVEDNSNYIPGTNIEKPRNRELNETDEEYVKYLEDYYAAKFPKGLAVLEDVQEPKEITDLKEVIKNSATENADDLDGSKDKMIELYDENKRILNNYEDIDSIDIWSNSNKEVNSIADEIEKEKNKSSIIEFASDEEREAFERSQQVDYAKDSDKETKKIGRIRKGLKSIKDVFKKHGKKIIAGILVATAAIGAALTAKSCAYDHNKEDLNENKDNPKSNADSYDTTVPSSIYANSFGVNPDDVLKKPSDKETKDRQPDIRKDNLSDKYDISNFDIGDTIKFNGDYIYKTSKDAANGTNSYTPLFSKDDKREISAVHFISPDGKMQMTATTKEEEKEFEKRGWKAQSYNMKNDTHNTQYEGWVTDDNISMVK